jgi:apolipoprotein N-acyltransferase
MIFEAKLGCCGAKKRSAPFVKYSSLINIVLTAFKIVIYVVTIIFHLKSHLPVLLSVFGILINAVIHFLSILNFKKSNFPDYSIIKKTGILSVSFYSFELLFLLILIIYNFTMFGYLEGHEFGKDHGKDAWLIMKLITSTYSLVIFIFILGFTCWKIYLASKQIKLGIIEIQKIQKQSKENHSRRDISFKYKKSKKTNPKHSKQKMIVMTPSKPIEYFEDDSKQQNIYVEFEDVDPKDKDFVQMTEKSPKKNTKKIDLNITDDNLL